MTATDPDYPPSGCTYCGISEQDHARQWTVEARWHAWTAPTDTQIKTRMLNRLRTRRATKES